MASSSVQAPVGSDAVAEKAGTIAVTDLNFTAGYDPATHPSPTLAYFGFRVVVLDLLAAMGAWGWRQLAVQLVSLVLWGYLVRHRDGSRDLPFFQHGRELLLWIVFMSYFLEVIYRYGFRSA